MTRPMLGKAEPPSDEHPMGVTVDGVHIEPGLVVWTNEYRPGTVLSNHRTRPSEWFDVEYATGGRVMQNCERVATVFEGKRATDALAEVNAAAAYAHDEATRNPEGEA